MKYYILNGHEVTETDMLTWAQWLESADKERIVAKSKAGDATVSTVFLEIDHNWDSKDPPHTFETRIFGGKHDGDQWRYATWDEAQEGHDKAVEMLNKEV